jgi:hypothetical protein
MGKGTIAANLCRNDGAVSPGVLVIEGPYEQTEAGRLVVEPGGIGAGELGKLGVNGLASLRCEAPRRSSAAGYLAKAVSRWDTTLCRRSSGWLHSGRARDDRE